MPAGTVIEVLTDADIPEALARSLGLKVTVYAYDPPLWIVTDRRTGRDRGSYVPPRAIPYTGSAHVIGVPGLFSGIIDPEDALRLFARETTA